MLNARLNRSSISRSAAVVLVTAVLHDSRGGRVRGRAGHVGTLSGTISDQMGRVVPGVALELTNVKNASMK
jgi:hypothetical protein